MNIKYYLSLTKNIDDTSILLNEYIAGKDKGGIELPTLEKEFTASFNKIEGTGRINSGSFVLKSTNLRRKFLRYAEFSKYIKNKSFLIAQLENGATAYLEGYLTSSSLAELTRSDSLNSNFKLEFICDYSAWKTAQYKNLIIEKLTGSFEIFLTEEQNTLLQDSIENNLMFLKVYVNQERNALMTFLLKEEQVLSSNQASMKIELDELEGFYFNGVSESRSLMGNFNLRFYNESRVQDVTSLIYEISNTSRNIIISGLQVQENIESLIYNPEQLIGV